MPRGYVDVLSNGVPISIRPRQQLPEIFEELLPTEFGAAESLRLIAPEARLFDAQVRACACRRERKRHHALQVVGGIVVDMIPGVGQRLVRLDGENLAIQHPAPVSAQTELMTHG